MVRSLLFSLVALIVVEFPARLLKPVSGQEQEVVVNEFDTSTGGFRITCDPAPAVCTFEESYGSYSYSVSGDPIGRGIASFQRDSDNFIAQDCEAEQQICTFVCDGVCGCETGVLVTDGGGSFEPDGGTCEIVSTNPGSVPTEPPTAAPSGSPTFDVAEATLYSATDMQEPSALRFRCDNVDMVGSPESYCDVIQGSLSYQISDDLSWGWTNCDENGGDCIVACSPVCTCEIATLADGGGFNNDIPGEPCTVIEPTTSPTDPPTDTSTATDAFFFGRRSSRTSAACWAFVVLASSSWLYL